VPVANQYDKMLDNVVYTATKEELTLMLYEGAIKFCNQALIAMEKKEVEKANKLIQRVEDIIREFQLTLDFKYDISKQFDDLYHYMYNRLVEANLNQNTEMLTEVLELFRNFRDMWKEAIVLARKEQAK
jgi:flagellar protein FliS